MKLLHLILIIVAILVLYMLFCGKFREFMTPNPYVLSWNMPSNNGGDPACCDYDWQICSDDKCATIVDSGTVSAAGKSSVSTETTKLDWATTYNVWIRAKNKFGVGDWAKTAVSTGNGVLSDIVIGETLGVDGDIIKPLGPMSANIQFYTSLTTGSVNPNTYKPYCQWSLTRGSSVMGPWPVIMAPGMSALTKLDTFQGEDAVAPRIGPSFIQLGDVVNVDVVIYEQDGSTVLTEGTKTMTVTGSAANGVTNVKLTYQGPTKLYDYIAYGEQDIGGTALLVPYKASLDQCKSDCNTEAKCDYILYDNIGGMCQISTMQASSSPGTGFWVNNSITNYATARNVLNSAAPTLAQSTIPAGALLECENNCTQTKGCVQGIFYDSESTNCVLKGTVPLSGHTSYIKKQ